MVKARTAQKQNETEALELEGYELSNGIYTCTYNWNGTESGACTKMYVMPAHAKRHWASHMEYDEQQRINKEALKVSKAEAIGGEVLREFADEIEKGVINIPELVSKLRITAAVVDSLLAEINGADLRVLTKKAAVYDKFAELFEAMTHEKYQEAIGDGPVEG